MPSLTAILAPLVLLLPLGALGLPVGADRETVRHQTSEEPPPPVSGRAPDWSRLSDPVEGQVANQVRIERRIILRISPRPMPTRRNLMAEIPRDSFPPRLVERPMGKCVAISGIAGVHAERGNRLMLFMRDQRIVAADLEDACSARDFYSGFYVEKNEDGRLCIDRDRLLSRSGAKCQVSRLRQMVLVSD